VLFTGGDNVARLIAMNGKPVREWRNAAALTTPPPSAEPS
jgi:hypothetical protein